MSPRASEEVSASSLHRCDAKVERNYLGQTCLGAPPFLVLLVLTCGLIVIATSFYSLFVSNQEMAVPGVLGIYNSDKKPTWWITNQKPSCSLRGSSFPRDFWFVKTKKVGGSTLALIMDQVSRRFGLEPIAAPEGHHGIPGKEAAYFQAAKAKGSGAEHLSLFLHLKYSVEIAGALFNNPLLFTATRNPLHRAYSQYYQKHQNLCPVGRVKPQGCFEDTEEAYMMFLESNRDFLTEYIRGDKNITDHQGILEQYDYVFVTERFDESLVLFSLTFGIPLRTLQYSSQLKNRQGIRPTASMKPDWLNNYTMYFYPNDLILWELANSKLDAQKAAIAERCGGHVVEDTLQNFKYLQGS